MGRFLFRGNKLADEVFPWFADWIGGPSLVRLENCPRGKGMSRGTVHIVGEMQDWKIPAVTIFSKYKVKGYVTHTETGFKFVADKDQKK